MDASDATQPKKQRTDAGPGPGDRNLPPGRFLAVVLAGEDDDAPIAQVAACMITRDLGLQLAGVAKPLRGAVVATFRRWDDHGKRMRGALDEREAGYPTARGEADAKLAAARAALAGEDLSPSVRAVRDAALLKERDADFRRRVAVTNADLPGVYKDLLKRDEEVTAALGVEQLEEKFDLEYHFKHVDTIFARVFG